MALASTSGITNYTPGASKHFTLTVSGSGGNAGFEITARPASNLSAGVAGNLVAGTGTQALCKVGTTCAAGNPQYIRSLSATATPATFAFDWTAPAGTEDVTLYVAAAVGYGGSTSTGTYLLKASGVAPPTLSVTPGSLSFSYQIGGAAPAAQTLSISGVAATYTAAAAGGTWLSVSPASSSASVSVNTAGLAAGSYSGSVNISASGSTGSPKTVPVTLNVAAAPTLTVTPASLSFAYQVGGTAPAAQTLSISGVAATYTAAASGGTWLSVSPASGGTSGSASVSVNTTGLAAGSYSGSVTITAAGSTGSPKTVPVALNVAAAPTLTVTPASLSFAYQIGGAAPVAQTLNISGVAATYTAAASAGTWLSVSPASGGTSGSASVSVNTAGLSAGSYSGSITIAAAGSTGSPKTVPVTFNVTLAPPTLTVTPASLSFAYQIGGAAPAAQTLTIGGVVSTFTAAASGGTWLSVSPASSSASVSVNTAGLAAGSYSGSVTIAAAGSTGSPKTVPVTFNVTPATPTLTVSPSSLSFAYQIGGAAPAAQTLNISGAATTYTAAAAGGTWLSVSPASGGTSGSPSVSVNTAGLAAGTYSGSVTITAAGSAGSPKTVPVTFNVTLALPTLTVSPTSLTFAYQVGGTAPAAQTLSIGGVATTYAAAGSGGTWLSVTPASGGTSGSASVSVNAAGLAAGTYSGSVTVTAAGSAGSPKTVPVTLNVTPASPTLTVSPASLTFAYQIGGTAPAAQSIAIGGGSLNYTVAGSGGAWLSVTPASGRTPGTVSVSVNTTGMVAGTYNATVKITVPGVVNGTQVVAVNLTLTDLAQSLQITPRTLSFSCATGNATPLPFVINVASGSTVLNYTAAALGGAWLSVAPTGGATPGAIFVSVNQAGLAVGTYNASITITSGNSAGKAQTVPVTLVVNGAGTSACPVVTADH